MLDKFAIFRLFGITDLLKQSKFWHKHTFAGAPTATFFKILPFVWPPQLFEKKVEKVLPTPSETRELAGAVGEGATPRTDGRPSENTPPWLGLHQSSLPNAAKGYPPREPRE